MILHVVTDRHRLAPAAEPAAARRCLLDQVRFAIEAGIDQIQVRERDLEPRHLVPLVAEIVTLARHARTRVVVNDRLDVALAAGAHGVHLPARGIPPAEARRIVPADFLVGRSVHTVEGAKAAAGADYLIAGTVWPSASKPGEGPLLGTAGLTAIVRAVSVPVLAIGGITTERVREVLETGAAGIAAIGLFAGDPAASGCRAVPLDALTGRLRSFTL